MGLLPNISNFRRQSILQFALLLVTCLAFSFGLTYSLLAAFRGIDLTDESFYVLTSSNPSEYLNQTSQWGHLIAPLQTLLGRITYLRISRTVLLVFANLAFAYTSVKYILPAIGVKLSRITATTLTLSISSAAFLSDTWSPQGFGYNETELILLYFALALAIGGVFSRHDPWLKMLALGAIFPLLVITKPTALLALIPIPLASQFLPNARRMTRRDIAFVLGGLGVVVAMTNFLLVDLSELIRGYSVALGQLDELHSPAHLIQNLAANARLFITIFISDFWPTIIALLVLLSVAKLGYFQTQHKRFFAFLVGIFLLNLWINGSLTNGFIEPEMSIYVLPVLVLIALPWQFGSSEPGQRKYNTFGIILSFAITPFAASFGTGNSTIFWNALSFGSCWVFIILCIPTKRVSPQNVLTPILVIPLTLLCISLGFQGRWLDPYRQVPLANASVRVESPPLLSGLYVDPITAKFFKSLRAQTSKLGEKPYVVTTDRMSGAVLALDGIQPLYSWIPAEWPKQAAQSLSEACLRNDRPIVLLSSGKLDPIVFSELLTCSQEISFKTTIESPRGPLEIWTTG